MVWAEPMYINIVPRISWYNLIIHLPVGPCFFHLQVRIVTTIESLVQIEMMLTLPLFIHCKEK